MHNVGQVFRILYYPIFITPIDNQCAMEKYKLSLYKYVSTHKKMCKITIMNNQILLKTIPQDPSRMLSGFHSRDEHPL